MADALPYVDVDRHPDLKGRVAEPWIRRVVLAVLAIFLLVALAGGFGQATESHVVRAGAADLRVVGASTLRGGLLWPARIEVRAKREIAHPRLILGPGWLRGMQVNTIEPAAVGESSRGERLVLSYDRLVPGDTLVAYLQAQVNPTTVGRQNVSVALDDETRPLARVDRTVMVLP